jgi:ATP-dependent Zn protease
MNEEFTSAWLESHRIVTEPVTAGDIVGIGHVMNEVESLVARFRNEQLMAEAGAALPRGILFYGPPGTGKTLTARYLVWALGADVPMYETSADELSPDRIRGTMRYLADTHKRAVLYIDEIDGFAMARGMSIHDSRTRQQLVAMLAALDGMVDTAGPVVIASSNREPVLLDSALTRPGRLGFHVRFTEPDEEERVGLFELFAKHRTFGGEMDWRRAARVTRGQTPAGIRQLLDDALGLALAAGHTSIRNDDVVRAINRAGLIEPKRQRDAASDWNTAVHETGHVAAAAVLIGPDEVYSVRLDSTPAETKLGNDVRTERVLGAARTADDLAISLAGWAAEQVIFGEPSTGCDQDITNVTLRSLARIEAGLEPGFTLLSPRAFGKLLGSRIRRRLNDTVDARAREAQAIAIGIVEANKDAILAFARTLSDARELSGDELVTALREANFARPAPTSAQA